MRYDLTSLQRVMGICPQHDTLFDSLTASEHLMIVCAFKGIYTPSLVRAEVERALRDVDLWGNRYQLATTFSGGMKRRLSVAMSSVGDPRIVFLDEPTTGMDPVVRRKIWMAINKLKADRLMVLTTHRLVGWVGGYVVCWVGEMHVCEA